MTRPRALTSTFRYVIALLTALLVAVVGATALPAAALAGHGQAKGQQADRADKPDKPGKAHQQGNAHQQSKAPATSNGRSAGKAHQGGSSHKAQEPTQAQEPQKAHGNSANAHDSKTTQAAPTSKPSGTSGGEKGDPKGNNGTVKLAGFEAPNGPGHSSGDGSTPMHPSNDPHLPCGFAVEGYGFDAIAPKSDLTFEQHAPTRGGGKQYDSIPLDQDSHSGGGSTSGYDGVTYPELTFVGEPHPKHGYHVKLTAHTAYSQGSNTKHKVFWVEPCEDTETPGGETPGGETPGGETPGGETPGGETPGGETPGGETPGGETPGGETPGGETPGGETPGGETPGGNTPGDNGGVQDTVDENGGNTSTVVFGAQASAPNSQAASQSAAASADVPTAVEAGLTGDEWSRSVLPLLAVLLGFGMTFVALMRRRTRAQAVTRD